MSSRQTSGHFSRFLSLMSLVSIIRNWDKNTQRYQKNVRNAGRYYPTDTQKTQVYKEQDLRARCTTPPIPPGGTSDQPIINNNILSVSFVSHSLATSLAYGHAALGMVWRQSPPHQPSIYRCDRLRDPYAAPRPQTPNQPTKPLPQTGTHQRRAHRPARHARPGRCPPDDRGRAPGLPANMSAIRATLRRATAANETRIDG